MFESNESVRGGVVEYLLGNRDNRFNGDIITVIAYFMQPNKKGSTNTSTNREDL